MGMVPTLWAQTDAWTPEDIVNQERVNEMYLAEDQRLLVWVKSRPDKKKDAFVSDLWMTRLDQPFQAGAYKQIQLTRSDDDDRNPVLSDDGETLYFLSSRAKGKALWAMSTWGGEPYVLDSMEVSPSNLKRLNDSLLVFEAEEGETLYEIQHKKDNSQVIEDTAHFKPTRLFSFHPKTREVKRLTDNRYPINEYAVSHDGKWIVTQHKMSPHYEVDGKPSPTYFLWNLHTGEKTQILREGYQTPGQFAFSPEDTTGFYFVAVQSSDPEWEGEGIFLLYFFDLDEMAVRQVPLVGTWGLSGGPLPRGKGVWVSMAAGAQTLLAYYERAGQSWRTVPLTGAGLIERAEIALVSPDQQRFVYRLSSASQPPQYRIGTLSAAGNGRVLTPGPEVATVNAHLKKKAFTRSEIITWTGALDEEVTGILYYPTHYEAGRRYPLVLSIHGGPSGYDTDSWQDRWSTYPHLLAEKGAFVLKPNYHGSGNHGQAFVESIKGHYYEYEIPDILSGIQTLVDKGMVDEDSLAVMGWSNGAILATMLTVQYPEKFKVCAAGAGDVNWTSDYGTCRFGVTFDQSYMGGAPWDNLNGKTYNERYVLKSPLFEMEKVKTPTIIFHGSEDRAVPRDQGWEYYRALQQIGQAPVRFLWFPGQRHGLAKLTHQLRKMTEEINWIDTYLWGTYDAPNEALKKGSPLMTLLNQKAKRNSEGHWGITVGGVLVPEVAAVGADTISVGIFEVTQAQFQAFRKRHRFPAAEANHPVVGLSRQDAQAYVAWLSRSTGDTYRLPNEKEARALHQVALKAAARENTLQYWAGYALTQDEVPLLLEKIASEGLKLFLPVGRFAPVQVGKAALYDLGGNAAEFSQEGVYGFSAYDFADKKAQKLQPLSGYIGLRVVRE